MLALRKLQLTHLLLGDVVGHHALGRALCSHLGEIEVRRILMNVALLKHVDQLGERRGNPHAGFVFHALVALAQHLFDDHGQIVALFFAARLAQIHEHRHERSLAVGGHERDHLVLDGLHATADFVAQALLNHLVDLFNRSLQAKLVNFLEYLAADLLAAYFHERRQMRQRDGLAAVLAASHLGNDLRGDVAGSGEAMRTLDERAGNNRAVLQHVVEVDQIAVMHVLSEIVGIMEVDDALFVSLDDVLRQQHAHGEVFGNLARHVVALNRVDRWVFVGVLLLHFLVIALDKRKDAVVCRVRRALQALHVAIDDVATRHVVTAGCHDLVFNHILDFLNRHGVSRALAQPLHAVGSKGNLIAGQAISRIGFVVGRLYSANDLLDIERNLGAAALDDFHDLPPLLLGIHKTSKGALPFFSALVYIRYCYFFDSNLHQRLRQAAALFRLNHDTPLFPQYIVFSCRTNHHIVFLQVGAYEKNC